MRRKKEILTIILVVLIAVFLMVGIAALLLVNHRKSEQRELEKQAALEQLEKVPTVTPIPMATIAPTATPTPTPTPRPTATPTPAPAFNPDVYWDDWYSTDGRASVTIYDISTKSVTFYFRQNSSDGTAFCEADVTAEITGNVAKFDFYDSLGNHAGGNFIFDKDGGLYVKIITSEYAGSVSPQVNCMMSRERVQIVQPTATPTPVPTATPTPAAQTQVSTQTGEYYFPESNSRYLTDEELANYSSADLELAKNEIYARHGRQFVTDYIAQYFEGKSWYQGTVDPETFDAQQDSIFNEYELANIAKIVEWEQIKRSEGN